MKHYIGEIIESSTTSQKFLIIAVYKDAIITTPINQFTGNCEFIGTKVQTRFFSLNTEMKIIKTDKNTQRKTEVNVRYFKDSVRLHYEDYELILQALLDGQPVQTPWVIFEIDKAQSV